MILYRDDRQSCSSQAYTITFAVPPKNGLACRLFPDGVQDAWWHPLFFDSGTTFNYQQKGRYPWRISRCWMDCLVRRKQTTFLCGLLDVFVCWNWKCLPAYRKTGNRHLKHSFCGSFCLKFVRKNPNSKASRDQMGKQSPRSPLTSTMMT